MKELLEKLAKGESTVDEVLTAIEESDKEKVPRSRLNDKIAEVKDLEGQLKDRDKQLDDLSKTAKDSADLTAEINRLKDENATQATEYQTKLQQQALDAKLNEALHGAKAKNPRAVKALLDAEQIKLDGEKLLGLDDQLSALKESDAYLFAEEETPAGLKGRNPHVPPGSEVPSGQKNPWKKDSFNLTEQGRLMREDPTLAQKLQAQA
ncbi:phage scaffolding protein [Planococcus citreus]|uniref:Minor structural protein GP20 n=1 Tax=Planococcus citreus TaxID=1373 RepID=A0A497YGP9_9BACL|nr:phage scaffolding protein [Planococcus citreus]RLJ90127.1 minor structural protein GP20 [Planococcus citreus]